MAEEQNAGGQSLWLLLVSLGLGLVVVVIYNVHIYSVRNAARGQSISLLCLTRDMNQGEKLKREDLEAKTVPKQYQESLGTVVTAEDLDYAVGLTVNRNLDKGRWLLHDYITPIGGDKPAAGIPAGHVAVGVELDSKHGVGDILRPHDRVNIVGMIGGKMQLIMKGVTVLGVGGEGPKSEKANVTAKPPRTYNTITIVLPQDVSNQWENLSTHISGGCRLQLLPSNINPSPDFERINPELKKYTEAVAMPAKGEWPGGAGPSGGSGGASDGATVPGAKTWE